MLTITVFWLLISGSVYGKLTEDKCLQTNSRCSTSADCCSKLCFPFPGTSFNFCIKAITEQVEIEACLIENQQCSRNADCCSNKCNKVGGKSFGTCILKPIENADTPSIVKQNKCIGLGHHCTESDNCCNGKCLVVYSFLHTALHSCVPTRTH